jgi:hypothetical protein
MPEVSLAIFQDEKPETCGTAYLLAVPEVSLAIFQD